MSITDAMRAFLLALVNGEPTEDAELEIDRAVRELHELAKSDRRGS